MSKPDFGFAQINANVTIPPYHWVQEYLQELQLRDPRYQFFIGTLPLSTSHLLQTVSWKSESQRFLYSQVSNYLNLVAQTDKTLGGQPGLFVGGLSSGRIGNIKNEMRSRLSQRVASGLKISPHFSIHNVVKLDETLRDDPTYTGKKWRGFAAITEQAYAHLQFDRFSLKFGRDYVRWGRGEDATLLISDESLPFDHLQLQFRTKLLQLTYFAAKLDPFALPASRTDVIAPQVERYLSGGRLDFHFFNKALQIGLSQAVLYAKQGSFELYYLNPFLIYHGEVINNGGIANSFGSFDFLFYPKSGIAFYGELLIDDFQVEKASVVDLEPGEYGYILGGRFADFAGLNGVTTGIEYAKVKNRTYNAPELFEQFTHRNKPIGHFLGNDFDRWLLQIRKYIGKQLRVQLQVDLRRHGEGSITAPWDTPWLNSTLNEGYSEPFPTGVVEKSRHFSFDLRWQPKPFWYVELAGNYSKWENDLNVLGVEKSETEVFLRVWLEWQKFFRI
ncbi:MAG: capsule assembly Wzi family protein [bacterium]